MRASQHPEVHFFGHSTMLELGGENSNNELLINKHPYVFGEYANLPVLDLETFVHALKVFYLFSAPGSFQVTHSLGWLQQPFSLALVEDLPGATPSLPKDSSNKNCSGFREQEF